MLFVVPRARPILARSAAQCPPAPPAAYGTGQAEAGAPWYVGGGHQAPRRSPVTHSLALALVVVFSSALQSANAAEPAPGPLLLAPGSPAPDFTAVAHDGRKVQLS